MLTFYLKGLGLGIGLIAAIGAQNAHVLKVGLLRQHIGLTIAVCIACDIALIALGVAGMGAIIESSPVFLAVARWGGAAFLVWYGLRAWHAALGSEVLQASARGAAISKRQALATIAGLTLLNPHVYLDTLILLGSIGGQQPGTGRLWFAIGAMTATTLWFSAIGYGARVLSPLFARPMAWRWLDALTGSTMLLLGAALAVNG